MKVWIGFLLLSFVLGGFEARRNRPARFILLFAICLAVAYALHSYRYV